MLQTIVTFFVLVSWTHGFRDCGSNNEIFQSVSIPGCNEDSVCVAKRNSDISIEITFTNLDTRAVTTKVYGIIGEVSIPWMTVNSCTDYGITCPITKNQNNNYKGTIKVLQSYPRISLDVKWELKDEHGDVFVCVMVPIKIK